MNILCIYTVLYTVYIMYYISNIYSTVSRWPSRRRRSQNAEQLWENGLLRCRRKPQSFKTYDSSEFGVWSLRKSKVYVHDTTLRSQNAEQLRENGWLRCSRKPQSFKTYDSSEFGVWSSYTVREAYKLLNLRKTTREASRSKAMKTPRTTNVKISKTIKLNILLNVKSSKRAT